MFKPLSATANRAVRKHEIAHLADVHRRRTSNPPRTLDTSTPDSAKYARTGNPKRLQQLYMRELEIERQNRILRSRIEHIGGTSRSGPVQSRRRRKEKRAQLRPAPLACDSAASLPAEDGIATSNDGARPVGEDHRAGEGTGAAGSAAGPRIRIVVSSDGEEVGEESYPLEYGEGRAAAAEGARTAPKSSHRGEGPPAGVASPGAKDLSFSDLHLLRMTRRREAEQERRQEENARLLHRLDRVRPVYSRERWREAMATHEHFRKLRQQQPTPKGMHGHPGSRASGSTRRAHAVQIVVESAENDWVDVHKQDIPQSPARRVSGDLAPEAEPASPRSASEGSSAPEGGGGGAGLPDGILGEVRRDSEGRVYVLGSGGGSVAGTDSRDGDRADLMAAAAALASATGSGGGAALPSAKGRSRRKRPGLRSSRSADARAYEALVRGPSRTPHPARLVAKGPSARQEARRLEEQRRWLERHRSGTQGGRRGGRTEAGSEGPSLPSRLVRPQGPWLCGSCDHLNSAATMNCLLCGALFMRAGRDGLQPGGPPPAPAPAGGVGVGGDAGEGEEGGSAGAHRSAGADGRSDVGGGGVDVGDRASGGQGESGSDSEEGEERAAGKEGEERAAGKEGEERAAGKEGEERAAGEEDEERAAGKEGEERAVGKEDEERAAGKERSGRSDGEDAADEGTGNEVNGGEEEDETFGPDHKAGLEVEAEKVGHATPDGHAGGEGGQAE